MKPGDIIKNNSGYQFCVRKYAEVDHLPIAILETYDSQQPFVMAIGLRLLPNGKCVFDRGQWYTSFSQCLEQFDIEVLERKMERYRI